ncbi:hypothetical protein E3A20_10760 [Planctomyces bekefii]|uniref:DUF2383 domain-containing protein n=1 Tax=Planctomyces bekefii TaxID=1653850 RepID=A0A5C6M4Y3_9PLAN|nr:hypothetical protein E3A20_10760 [Planctomyces bekefii]
MIILQTAGSGNASGMGVGRGLLADLGGQVTTFEENDYIHKLNRTLQAEMHAVAAYRSLSSRPDTDSLSAQESHQRAGRELVRLIIENRGIPEDRAALSFGLAPRLIRLVVKVPSRFTDRMTLGTLSRVELQLIASYRKLMELAPSRDMQVLQELLACSESHLSALSELL